MRQDHRDYVMSRTEDMLSRPVGPAPPHHAKYSPTAEGVRNAQR
jgi:hypothetical protein